MKMNLNTEIRINAPPYRVWQILTDFAAYPQWNPFITRISGVAQTGGRLHITVQPVGGKAMSFSPRVSVAEQPELRWQGKLLLPGLFDGEHFFLLEDLGNGQTKLVHGEHFSGLLVGLFARSLEQGTLAGFEKMNLALKQRAEQAAQAV